MIKQIDMSNANKKLNIRVYPAEGEMIELEEKDIVNSQSVSISYKCGSDSDFAFASVYAAECTFTFKTDIDRYALYDARIEVFCGNGTESFGKGVYYISEAVRQNDYVSIKAYDQMLFLDSDVDEEIVGTVYEILCHLSNRFGLELGMSESFVKSLPNAEFLYSVSSDIIDTWRDVLHYLAAVTCTFAVFDGNGKLCLCRYHESEDKSFDKNGRANPSVSDYEVSFDGISARFVLNGTYMQYSASEAEAPKRIYDAGDIPIVRLTKEHQQQIISNMLAEILKISYVPVSMKIRFNPFLELGDKVTITDVGKTGDSVSSYVMNLKWSFRGLTQVKSVGENPKLATVKDKNEKRLSSLEGSIQAKDVAVHSYTNIKNYVISSGETEVITINFSAAEDTNPIFMATIPFMMDTDGNVIIKYYFDGVLNADDTLISYIPRGQQFLTVTNNFKIDGDTRKTLTLTMSTRSFDSDIRKHEAQIASIVEYIKTGKYQEPTVTGTVPQMRIETYGIKAVLFAQGLDAKDRWDGTIIMNDDAPYIKVLPLDILPCNDKADFTSYDPIRVNREEAEYIELEPLPVRLFHDNISCIEEEENE